MMKGMKETERGRNAWGQRNKKINSRRDGTGGPKNEKASYKSRRRSKEIRKC